MQDKVSTPPDGVHLEDIEVGRVVEFGRISVSKEDIISFARAYDPQPMHLDEEAAKASIVGGLCASGFHSCAIMMRMLADGLLNDNWTSLGSPGIDECRWLKPLFPDQILTGRVVCTEKRALASRPEVGLLKVRFEMLDAAGDVIMVWDSNQLLKVRKPGPKSEGKSEGRPPLESLWDGPEGPAPDPTRNYFEDRHIGEMYDLGSHTFARDEIIAFARQFDPQPFHLDEEAGRKSLFGGLCASGWHTAAIWIRQFVAYRQGIERRIREAGAPVARYGPSPGFRNLRWLKPVYPGDTLMFRGRTAGKIDLKSRPDRGILQTDSQARNQRGEIVFSIRGQIMAERREPYRL
ncbi:MAG: MaoC family dehydratase [Hyphomicrobiaceae bacterium]